MTAYRDDVTALAARHQALTSELEQKTREVADAAQLLEEARARRSLPILDNVRVASPCSADWEQMVGDDRARACASCQKTVYNLSELTRYEAESLILEKAGQLCARYYQRKDGTILLADCTVGAKKKRKRRLLAAGAAALLSGTGGYFAHDLLAGPEVRCAAQDEDLQVTLGVIAVAADPSLQGDEPTEEPGDEPTPETNNDSALPDDLSMIQGDISPPDPEQLERLRVKMDRIKRLKELTPEQLEALKYAPLPVEPEPR